MPRATLAVAEAGWTIALAASAGHCGPAAHRIDLTWGEHAFSVWCPGQALDAAVDRLAPGLAATGQPSDLAALLVEAAFLPALVEAERATGRDIRVVGVVPEASPAGDAGLGVEAVIGGRSWALRVEAPSPTVTHLLAAWPLAPRAMEWLPFPATLRIGSTRLPLKAARSLLPGDAVILEVGGGRAGVLVIAEAWQASASRQAEGWVLEGRVRPMLPPDDVEWPMRDDEEGIDDVGPIGDADELPVRLTFEVGRIEIPLGELRRLGAGAVLELGRDIAEPVRISVNGRPVGQGMLVDVDGRVGVRIARIFDHG